MTGDGADRARLAAEEQGPVAVLVRCSRCGPDAEPLAVVRRSSAGLVFEGRQATGPEADSLASSLESMLGGEVPFRPAPRVMVLLEEEPGVYTDWPPRATCAVHGIEVYDSAGLVEKAAEATEEEPATFKPGPRRAGHE